MNKNATQILLFRNVICFDYSLVHLWMDSMQYFVHRSRAVEEAELNNRSEYDDLRELKRANDVDDPVSICLHKFIHSITRVYAE